MTNNKRDDWERDADDNIRLCPLQLFHIATDPAETFLALRIGFWNDGDASDRPSGNVQLGLTVKVARDLAQSLLAQAERIDGNVAGPVH